MGLFFGAAGVISYDDKLKIDKIYKDSNNKFESGDVYVLSGGPEFSYLYSSNNSDKLLCICGIPCVKDKDTYRLADLNDFENIADDLANNRFLDGHFAGISANANRIKFFNDLWSYRDVYFYEYEEKTIFSTRLDWICRFIGEFELDEKEFSGLWLMKNQTSLGVIIKGVQRLGPGSKAEYSNGKLNVVRAIPQADFNETIDISQAALSIENFIQIDSGKYKNRTLALSGGFDSRFLAAIFNKTYKNTFNAFTFGDENSPEVIIAKQIAKDLNIKFDVLQSQELNKDTIVKSLIEFSGYCQVTASVSEYLLKMNYSKAFTEDNLIFDGGMAEIFRRSLLNRGVLFVGEDASPENADKIFSVIEYTRPNIFKDSFYNKAKQYAIQNCKELAELLPDVKSIGKENWFDYFSTVLKVCNYCGLEQVRIDQIAPSLTPFVQASILKVAFSTKLKYKRKSILFKKIIKKYAAILTKPQLAKGSVTTPYFLSPFFSKILALAKKRLNLTYIDSSKALLFNTIKQDILELVNSDIFKNIDFIDENKIRQIVQNYYEGDKRLEEDLDWIITLGFFLKSCKIEN